MLRVGLTGGIACGKSRVLLRLAGHGFHTLDLDAVARELTSPGHPALAEIAEAFGPSVLTREGALDRPALATRVFASPEELARLNAIVHPRVRAEEERRAAALGVRGDAVLVTDAALLVESGAHLRFDRMIVAYCEPVLQVARLRARDGLDEAAARARIAAQMPADEKRGFGHFVVDTSGSPEETDSACDRVAEELSAAVVRPPRMAPGCFPALLGLLAHGPRTGPRGLTPAAVLESIAVRGGLELAALARMLAPPSGLPWYRAARETPALAPAELLAGAVVAWALTRRAGDASYLAAAASSLARLTHSEGEDRASACLMSLVAHEIVTYGAPMPGLASVVRTHTREAERWGGGPPSPRLQPVWFAVQRHPDDPVAAAEACRSLGGEPALAGALAGAIAGWVTGAASRGEDAWRTALARIGLRP